MFRKVIGVERKRVTEACTHCGQCSDVCPVNNVTVSEDAWSLVTIVQSASRVFNGVRRGQ